MRYFLLFFIFTFSNLAFAQELTDTTKKAEPVYAKRTVFVYSAPGIDDLVRRHVNINRRAPKTQGFRVQITQDNDIEAAREKKIKALDMFPQYRVYEVFEPPFYKIRVGDFRNRFDAYEAFYLINQSFSSSFIVMDYVNGAELR